MKHFFLLLLFSISILGIQAQSCCESKTASTTSATAEFASLANDENFRQAHAVPKIFNLAAPLGETITYETPDGKTSSAYMIKSEEETNNYLFVIHEWWGLNDYVRAEAEKLSEALGNVHVIALDMYDGKVATSRENARAYMQGVQRERAKAIINGAIAYAGEDARIGTIGWCFGGGWSLQASLLLGDQAAGCVIYYGMPEKDVEKLKTLQTDVLGIFGKKDGWINPKVVAEFEENMEAAGKKLDAHIFDAAHAFANPSRSIYDEKAALEAHKLTVTFLKERF